MHPAGKYGMPAAYCARVHPHILLGEERRLCSRRRAFRNALIGTKKGLIFGTSGNCVAILVPSFSEDSGNRGTKRSSLVRKYTFHISHVLPFDLFPMLPRRVMKSKIGPVRADRYIRAIRFCLDIDFFDFLSSHQRIIAIATLRRGISATKQAEITESSLVPLERATGHEHGR